jgi:transcriptional regulator with XRE-family HTH domain
MSDFYKRLRIARDRRSLTQSRLAAQAGISLRQLTRYELGHFDPTATPAALARTLGVSLDWLAGLSEQQGGETFELSPDEWALIRALRLDDYPAALVAMAVLMSADKEHGV